MALLSRCSRLLRAVAQHDRALVDVFRSSTGLQNGLSSNRHLSSVTGIDISEEWFLRQRKIIVLGNKVPTKAPDTWIAPNAVVAGDVDLLDKVRDAALAPCMLARLTQVVQVSIWYGAVLRGDLNNITVGSTTTIQDRTVIHAARTSPTGLTAATIIGKNVIIEAACVLRSCRIGDSCIVGSRSSLMEGSMMESFSILAPGSVLPPARRVPEGELWAGNPARFVRKLTKDEKDAIAEKAVEMRAVGYKHWVEELPYGTAWRDVEDFRAASIKAGGFSEVDIRSARYNTRIAAEKEAAEKLS